MTVQMKRQRPVVRSEFATDAVRLFPSTRKLLKSQAGAKNLTLAQWVDILAKRAQ